MAAESAASRGSRSSAPATGSTPECRERLARLLALLDEDASAPTAVSRPELAVDVHIADSLTALELERVRAARAIADIGSGAGLPGLALAAALPAAHVWLVESRRRKCEFIERVGGAHGARERDGRVRARRAVARGSRPARPRRSPARSPPQPVVLEYAAPLLAPGGALVDWRGSAQAGGGASAAAAAAELGLELEEVRAVAPLAGASGHHLHVCVKREATPARFPRRAGIARKRPLGA